MEILELIINEALYLFGIALVVPVWLMLFFRRPGSRREMLIAGTIGGILSLSAAFLVSLNDYWQPPYILGYPFIIEDFLYGFIFVGIASELGEAILQKRSKKSRSLSVAHVIVPPITALSVLLAGTHILNTNSTIIMVLLLGGVGFTICVIRNDLITVSLISGLALMVLTTIVFLVILQVDSTAIEKFWKTENLAGMYVWRIPIEELLFAFLLGFSVSNFYEFFTRSTFTSVPHFRSRYM